MFWTPTQHTSPTVRAAQNESKNKLNRKTHSIKNPIQYVDPKLTHHKLHTVDATIFENVWHTGILTSVAFEAELRVGINGVDPVL